MERRDATVPWSQLQQRVRDLRPPCSALVSFGVDSPINLFSKTGGQEDAAPNREHHFSVAQNPPAMSPAVVVVTTAKPAQQWYWDWYIFKGCVSVFLGWVLPRTTAFFDSLGRCSEVAAPTANNVGLVSLESISLIPRKHARILHDEVFDISRLGGGVPLAER